MPIDPASRRTATGLLTKLSSAQLNDPSDFLELLYDEMRQLAKQMMGSERENHTLQPTSLVHEVFLRLINAEDLDINSKDHFYILAAQTMRRILIDHARSNNRLKRGGGQLHLPLTIADPESKKPLDPSEILALDEALEKLRLLDERKMKIVELRFFGGLDEESSARILGIARSTASNDWRFARAWLMNELKDDTGSTSDDPA